MIPLLNSKETWKHTWGRCLLIAWYWAIVGSIGSWGGCGPWLPTIAGLMIPWVDRLGLPKWRHRWSWLVDVHYECIPNLVSPKRWKRREKLVKINFLKTEQLYRVGSRHKKGLTLSGSSQPNCSHTTTGSFNFLPQPVARLPPQSKDLLLWTPCFVTDMRV